MKIEATLTMSEARPSPTRPTRPLRVARMLAVAHTMRRLLDSGAVRTQEELGQLTEFTPPRITQMLDLLLLAPDIQEEILLAEVSGRDWVSEHSLRQIVAKDAWAEQRRIWRIVRKEASLSA